MFSPDLPLMTCRRATSADNGTLREPRTPMIFYSLQRYAARGPLIRCSGCIRSPRADIHRAECGGVNWRMFVAACVISLAGGTLLAVDSSEVRHNSAGEPPVANSDAGLVADSMLRLFYTRGVARPILGRVAQRQDAAPSTGTVSMRSRNPTMPSLATRATRSVALPVGCW